MNNNKFIVALTVSLLWPLFSATHFGAVKTGVYDAKEKGVEYSVFVPKDFNPQKKYPLILALYEGSGGDFHAKEYVDYWMDVAKKRGYVVVCPEAKAEQERGQVWKPLHWELVDDPPRILNLLPSLKSKYNIDPNRILLVGIGSFPLYVGINNPVHFSAVAAINGYITISNPPNSSRLNRYNTDSKRYFVADMEKAINITSDKKNQIPVLFVNGKDCLKVLKEDDVKNSVQKLKNSGYDASYQIIDGMGCYHDEKVNPIILDWFESKTK